MSGIVDLRLRVMTARKLALRYNRVFFLLIIAQVAWLWFLTTSYYPLHTFYGILLGFTASCVVVLSCVLVLNRRLGLDLKRLGVEREFV